MYLSNVLDVDGLSGNSSLKIGCVYCNVNDTIDTVCVCACVCACVRACVRVCVYVCCVFVSCFVSSQWPLQGGIYYFIFHLI